MNIHWLHGMKEMKHFIVNSKWHVVKQQAAFMTNSISNISSIHTSMPWKLWNCVANLAIPQVHLDKICDCTVSFSIARIYQRMKSWWDKIRRSRNQEPAFNHDTSQPRDFISIRSVIDTKGSDGIDDPLEKVAMKSHSGHSDSGIRIMQIVSTLTMSSYCIAIRWQSNETFNACRLIACAFGAFNSPVWCASICLSS